MRVRMRRGICHRRIVRSMRVSVVSIMHVRVLVRHRLMNVFVFVALAQMQPHANSHECCSADKRHRGPLTENN